ncbi:MAG TPA: branched-chain amino acid ABC transporter permease [Methylomirabilota bacterium]
MLFLVALLVDGALAGAIYALIALGFVVVYKASRVINFALGEWLMLGALLVAVGAYRLALGLPGAVLAACVGMIGFAVLFNRLVLRRLVGRPVVSLIMVTLGLGALMRGGAALLFRGIPGGVPLPLPQRVLEVGGLFVSIDKLVAGIVAAAAVAAVTAAFRWTRTGVALRAIADDDRAALAAGIDVQRHLVIAWGTLGVLSVVAGTLWTSVASGGLGLVLVGLKVFPVVVIGGLDSIPATILAALLIGLLETLTAGYVDPIVGTGFSTIAPFVLVILVLFTRPYGLLGSPDVRRV